MAYIEIKNYCKTINSNPVLSDISLSLEKGKIYGLVGKNGSGKTMLIRAVCGLITADSGSVSVDGRTVGNGVYPKSVGLVIENVTLFENMSAFKNLKMLNDISRDKISENEIKEWLEKFSLDPSDKKSIKKYSLGMKQKVSIIQAFMNNPDLLLLDEPTNALDSDTVNCLVELIHNVNRDRGATFIIASHDRVNLDGLCDKIIEMREGKIV